MFTIAVIGCVIDNLNDINCKFNSIIEEHKDIILARMGVPISKENISVVSLIVKGPKDRIHHLSEVLSMMPTVSVSVSYSKKELREI